MADLVDVISSEFEDAMEVRNAKSLHRGVFLLVSSMVKKEEHVWQHFLVLRKRPLLLL